jgi:hypothetical protein
MRRPPHRVAYAADNLPGQWIIAVAIVEDLETALAQFREIAADRGAPEEVLR